jgi:hypothetical protein
MLLLSGTILYLFSASILCALPLIPFNHNLILIASSLANINIIFLTPRINNFSDGLSSLLFSSARFQLKWKLNETEYDNQNHVCSFWWIWILPSAT